MGKKVKVGKARRDKFYHLAKESGFRARSAFKLAQLNKKFGFLQNAKVIIDLCAAPGGWLQVAAEAAPVESHIIGVDIVPIRPIPRVITLQEDITTDKCRQALSKELHTWKADCVLNDGAPNVGKNWIHDAFQQAELTLSALKLAVEFLRKGGWFVTKVFRSKDYEKLLWVFNQLFKEIKSTKPAASRSESAEIFVVCKGFIAPDKLDPRFLDPKHVFKDVDEEPSNTLDLLHPEKKKRHRDGYAENDFTLYHPLKVSEFLSENNHLERFATASEIILDDEKIRDHPLTTPEIKECLKDIKVLGKKDINLVMNWRKKMLKHRENIKESPGKPVSQDTKEDDSMSQQLDDEEAELTEKLAELKEEERKIIKRKLRKIRKEKSKLRHKMDTKMILPGDQLEIVDDINLFDLKRMNRKNLAYLEEANMAALDMELPGPDDVEEDDETVKRRKWMASYDRNSKDHLEDVADSEEEFEEEPEFSNPDELEEDINMDEEEERNANPLIIDLETKETKGQLFQSDWFSKDIFADVIDTEDLDNRSRKIKNAKAVDRVQKLNHSSESEEDCSDDDDDSSSDDDSDSSERLQQKSSKADTSVIPPAETLDAEGLAIATKMVSSRKRKRDMLDDAYHRYMFDDEGLPDWFVADEKKHTQRPPPVTKGEIEEYNLKMKAINAQPIKKIAESKARKKNKMLKKLERARKRADAISDSMDTSDKEKWQQMKQIYKKAGLLKNQKKDVTYVFAKKGTGKKVRRPPGVSGPFRVVDKRMKKDNMRQKQQLKASGKSRKRNDKMQMKSKKSR